MFNIIINEYLDMAKKKAGGSTALGRDSISKRLGVKLHDGQYAKAGSILIRQRGSKYLPGKNVKTGKDDTLFSGITGYVSFSKKKKKRFDGKLIWKTVVNVNEKK